MPVIPALGKLRQGIHEFEDSLGCIVRLSFFFFKGRLIRVDSSFLFVLLLKAKLWWGKTDYFNRDL